jgi:hypothetical protein
VPPFLDDGRLLWHPDAPIMRSSEAGIHLTDLNGGHDVFVHTHFRLGHKSFEDETRPWVSGDRLWFTGYDSGTLKGALYTASMTGPVTKVADKVAIADVADGTVVWVTTDGQVVTESDAGGQQHTVTVPLTAGCRMPTTQSLQNSLGAHPLAVSGSVIALTEACGTGLAVRQEVLAFDLAGHALVHITGLYGFNLSLGKDDLIFQGLVPGRSKTVETLRYDLVTGSLARLSEGAKSGLQAPLAAGDYVLWYDKDGGHVARIPG